MLGCVLASQASVGQGAPRSCWGWLPSTGPALRGPLALRGPHPVWPPPLRAPAAPAPEPSPGAVPAVGACLCLPVGGPSQGFSPLRSRVLLAGGLWTEAPAWQCASHEGPGRRVEEVLKAETPGREAKALLCQA